MVLLGMHSNCIQRFINGDVRTAFDSEGVVTSSDESYIDCDSTMHPGQKQLTRKSTAKIGSTKTDISFLPHLYFLCNYKRNLNSLLPLLWPGLTLNIEGECRQ
jgi:hypothetical protein